MKVTRRVVGWLMLCAGVVADALAWLGWLAASEPPTVVHLSTWALIFSGLDAVLIAEGEK